MTVYVLWDVSLCAGRLGSGCQDLAADGFTQLVVHFIMFFRRNECLCGEQTSTSKLLCYV